MRSLRFWLAITLMVIFFLLPPPARAVVIWEDGFESKDFSAWSGVSGNWTVVTSTLAAYEGNCGANIQGNTITTPGTLWKKISTEGYQNLTLDFAYKIRDGLEDDHLFLDWTLDGSTWFTLADYTNLPTSTDWQLASFSLPAAADNTPLFAFQLLPQLGAASDRVNLDRFRLTGEAVPEPSSLILAACALGCLRRKRHC